MDASPGHHHGGFERSAQAEHTSVAFMVFTWMAEHESTVAVAPDATWARFRGVT